MIMSIFNFYYYKHNKVHNDTFDNGVTDVKIIEDKIIKNINIDNIDIEYDLINDYEEEKIVKEEIHILPIKEDIKETMTINKILIMKFLVHLMLFICFCFSIIKFIVYSNIKYVFFVFLYIIFIITISLIKYHSLLVKKFEYQN
jgi:hypothetical protein